MTRRLIAAILMLAAPTAISATEPPPAVSRVADEAAIAALVENMERAWNAHDAKAYAGLFHPDAAFITFQGDYLKGRAEIEAVIASVHATIYRKSVSDRRVEDMTFIGPDAVVVHVYRTNFGISEKPIPSRNTLVVTRRDGKWGILAFQNTRLIDPADRK